MKNILIIGCGLLGSSILRRIHKKKIANQILEDKTGKRLFSEAKRIFLSKMDESKQSDELAIAINTAIEKIDDSMSYVDFAQAVGKVIRDEYGTHLYKEFKKEINKSLKESVDENRMLRKGQFRFNEEVVEKPEIKKIKKIKR